MKERLSALVLIILTTCSAAWASHVNEIEVPASLEPWKAWVLHGEEKRLCPTSYDDENAYRCIWPSRLNLNLDSKGGTFEQQWLVFAKGWVPLPGGKGMWPQEVTANGTEVSVLENKSAPCIYVAPGEYRVRGRFIWEQLPEMIHVPPAGGLLDLTLNGKSVHFPLREMDGRLWLKKEQAVRTQEDRMEVRIYRLLTDSIPMRMTTLLRVNISGQPREISLKGVELEGFTPMSIRSPIPARMANGGQLMIQVRPGRWEISVVTRSAAPVHNIGPLSTPYGQEVWAFQSRNHLRMVKIEGVPSIDPNQTDSPSKWRRYPTYLIDKNSALSFRPIRRGDPDPAPDQLSLERTWWLDFDGKGLTLRDKIAGAMSRQWALAMNPPVALGRVTVDGTDRLITARGKDKRPGVELRRGRLDLTAESRIESKGPRLPAVGWDHDFQKVSGTLNLPPGWRLLTVQGVDVMPGTWFERWTLLDLFLVLIIALAVSRLWGWPWGILALFTVGLTYHEIGSPRLVWLSLMAATALLRFLPRGWISRLTRLWRIASLVTLLALAVPFVVQQVRWGIYPQLEPRYVSTGFGFGTARKHVGVLESRRVQPSKMTGVSAPRDAMDKRVDYYSNQAVQAIDANALNQTGPGLPNWTWRSFSMQWNGPVEKDQDIRFWLLSPTMNLFLAFVRVILLVVLILRLLDLREWRVRAKDFVFAPLLLCMLLFVPLPARAEADTAGYPSKELLEELRERLLGHPDRLPRCAQSPRMELTATSGDLRILFEVHAALETAVPLPGSAEFWLPKEVLLDSRPAGGLERDKEGLLWILVPRGIHKITLTGPTPPEKDFQVSLPLVPRQVTFKSDAWEIQGIGENGTVEGSIKLVREESSTKEGEEESARTALPPFFHVERILSLGLDWQVRSRITRLTPVGSPVVVAVPLLEGESVTTSGLRVKDGKVPIHMDPRVSKAEWHSTLKKDATIHLEAPTFSPWTETWTLETSPIWHCELGGIPVIHHQDKTGYWRPQWKPWPGEAVSIHITRPRAIPGQVVTLDAAGLTYIPGQRFNKATLALNIRTSQGGQHRITLPDGARLQGVKIKGKEQPIREQGGEVIVPLQPGEQGVEVQWHQGAGPRFRIQTPGIDIGEEAVNADVIIQMPRNRWILWATGPRLGPAVLFWSYLVVVVLGALALGRLTWTPLRTWHWLLLGLGLTQVHPLVAILIVGWLLALGLRRRREISAGRFSFDLVQILLVVWTIAALIGLYVAIQKGLLGIPHMQIAGNGSYDFWLKWTQDRIGHTMPRPSVFSVHILVFRLLMLCWALWLAYSLLKWLRWGWECFNEGEAWRKLARRKKKPLQEKDAG